MAEVLGVVSAAAQLATLCCSLLRLLKSIKTAPATLQNYGLQLQDISLLSSSISRNPLLQTAEIEALTQSLHTLISQTNLTLVLRKHRIIRAFYLFCNERDIVDTLSAVERQKLSLCLSIEHIQSEALYEIRDSIQSMSPQAQKIGQKGQSITKSAKKATNPLLLSSDNLDLAASKDITMAQAPTSITIPLTTRPSGSGTTITGRISNVFATGNVSQNVGGSMDCDASELNHLRNDSVILNVHNSGTGTQRIGYEVMYEGTLAADFNNGHLMGTIDGVWFHGVEGASQPAKQSIGPFVSKRRTGREQPCKNQEDK